MILVLYHHQQQVEKSVIDSQMNLLEMVAVV
jgi:hypothetical protein